jgi:hypothetical protein
VVHGPLELRSNQAQNVSLAGEWPGSCATSIEAPEALAETAVLDLLAQPDEAFLRLRSNVQGRFLRCHAPGVTPTISLNTRAKWLCSANPVARATSDSEIAPSLSMI